MTEAAKRLGLVTIASGRHRAHRGRARAGGGGGARAQAAAAAAPRAAPCSSPRSARALEEADGRPRATPGVPGAACRSTSRRRRPSASSHRARLGPLRRALRLRPRRRGIRPPFLRPADPEMHKVVLWVQAVARADARAARPVRGRLLRLVVPELPEINDILVVTSSAAHPGAGLAVRPDDDAGLGAGCLVLWELGRRGARAFLVQKFGRGGVERVRRAARSRDGTSSPSPSRPCCRRRCRSRSSCSPRASSASALAPLRGHPDRRPRPALRLLGVMGAVYGDEALGCAAAVRPPGSRSGGLVPSWSREASSSP